MIDSIRDRDVFVRLGRDGVRFRREALSCTYLHQSDLASPRFAFAIGRHVGPAVVRNRLRRRLRMIVRQNEFPTGYWLIGARPRAVELTFAQLETTMLELAAAVSASREAQLPATRGAR